MKEEPDRQRYRRRRQRGAADQDGRMNERLARRTHLWRWQRRRRGRGRGQEPRGELESLAGAQLDARAYGTRPLAHLQIVRAGLGVLIEGRVSWRAALQSDGDTLARS